MGLVIPFKLMFHREKIVFDRLGCRIWISSEEVFTGLFQLQLLKKPRNKLRIPRSHRVSHKGKRLLFFLVYKKN